jgi:hypothetical protein
MLLNALSRAKMEFKSQRLFLNRMLGSLLSRGHIVTSIQSADQQIDLNPFSATANLRFCVCQQATQCSGAT